MPKHRKPFNIKGIGSTVKVSLRLIKLVWSIDAKLFSLSVLATLVPAIVPFITAYIGKLTIEDVVNYLTGHPAPLSHLYVLLGIGLVVYLFQNIAFRTQDFVNSLLWTKLPITLNQMIFEKTASLDMQYFEDSKFKDLLQKVREGYNYRTQNQVGNLLYLFQSFIQVVISAVALIHLNFFLLFIMLLLAIPEFINDINQSKLSFGMWDANTKHRKRYWYLSDLLQSPWSVKEIKLFDLSKNFLKEIKTIQTKFYDDNASLAKRTYIINIGLNVLSAIFSISIQIFVIIQALNKKITIGDINFYQTVISNFQNGLGGLFNNLNRIFDNSQYVQSIFELFDAEPFIVETANPVSLDLTKAPLIEFRDVTFGYPGKKEKALHNFNLTIHPGEKVAMVGENGAGKSTIIKLLARFYDVDEGELLINNVNIKDVKLTELYQLMGILFQDFNRYEDSVKDNIAYGDISGKRTDEYIVNSAKAAGAHSFITDFDRSYEQVLGKTFDDGVELSTGQWQKMALARAFFRNANMLILDEPTAAIDAKAESEIFDRVDRLSKDKTVIIISHRFSTVRNADTIYVIEHGKVKESGSHNELMKLKGQYSELFNLQAKRYQ
ncbi:ABC transporter ATP-binding protein [soil metagenome]